MIIILKCFATCFSIKANKDKDISASKVIPVSWSGRVIYIHVKKPKICGHHSCRLCMAFFSPKRLWTLKDCVDLLR